MSVTKMQKLTVIVPIADADDVMRRLMKLRAVSLTRTEREGTDLSLFPAGDGAEAAAGAARVDAVLPALTKRSRRKKQLFRPATPVVMAEFRRSGRYDKAWKTVAETEKIVKTIADRRADLAAEENLMKSLVPYLTYPYPLNDPGTEHTTFLLGAFPASVSDEKIGAALGGLGAVAETLNRDKQGVTAFVICHKSEREAVMRALTPLGFAKAAFIGEEGTATEAYDAADRRADKIRDHLDRLEGRLLILADNLTDVEILSDIEHTTKLTEENKRQLAATEKCAVLSGWCPVPAEGKIVETLAPFAAAYEFEDPAEGDDVPVLLSNNAFARNFEWVLGMYAYPKYGRYDPTFIMSIFYFLIFGLMFADVGYGLLLTVICFGAVRWFKPRQGMKRFLLMFGFCGISCILCGVLFGSYFGDFPLAFMRNMLHIPEERLPNLALIKGGPNIAVLLDPLQSPVAFLVLSLGVGAVHLLTGMAIKAVILCRDGHPLDALFDIGSYWLLFGGIATLVFYRTPGIILTVAGVLAILATQGRAKKGVFGKILGGFGGLYGLIGYASDLLSYSRILALGLASAVLGQVINMMATMKGATFAGFIMLLLVFTLGHLLNLAINVLGTFVHTARLQYIEFFGKFYEDGGTPFRPIAPADKYSEEVTGDSGETTPANAPQTATAGKPV